ncbi:hypothetical protein K6W26_00840 [Burkholderia sp. AU42008]|uniref:hypothetical protein n=1 Tax=unclassified Burkholderia TaxID=2613784 RepID=UPI0015C59B62|nr:MULTISPECIES: hypothetical protein [unclassified Burkholderia]MBR8238814.1 hypothetical protein [Burkholderia sp. AU32357]MBY4871618.1 hypothetical protein [Burkholderia sp. AU42008]
MSLERSRSRRHFVVCAADVSDGIEVQPRTADLSIYLDRSAVRDPIAKDALHAVMP